MGYWAEIRNDYFDETIAPNEGDLLAAISIDAWHEMDDAEEGKVIAQVLLSKHGDVLVDYRDGVARADEMAQAAIQEATVRLREYFAEKQKEACKGSVASLGASAFVGWEDIDKALDRWAKEYFGEHVSSVGSRDENDFEISLGGLEPEDYEKYVRLFEVYDTVKDYEPDDEETFGDYGTVLPAEMTKRLMGEVLDGIGLVSFGTALATYDGVYFMERGRNQDREYLREKSQDAKEENHALALGAPAYVFFIDEETGVAHIDEFAITDISHERIWLNGDFDYHFKREQIGEDVFLSRESAVRYAQEHGMRLAQPDLDEVIQNVENYKSEGTVGARETPMRRSDPRDM